MDKSPEPRAGNIGTVTLIKQSSDIPQNKILNRKKGLCLGRLKVKRVIMWMERPRPAFMEEVIIKRSYKEQLEFEQRAKDRTFYLEILNLGTRNVLEQIILCHGVCLVHCRMFSSIPSL